MKIINVQEVIPKDDLYYCGSLNLKDFLEKNEIIPISSYTKKKTKKNIYIYVKSNKLSELLTMWSNNKRKGGEDD